MPVITARSRSTSRSPANVAELEEPHAAGQSASRSRPQASPGRTADPERRDAAGDGGRCPRRRIAGTAAFPLPPPAPEPADRAPAASCSRRRTATRSGEPTTSSSRCLSSRPVDGAPGARGVTLFLNECSRAVMGWAISLQPSSAGFSRPCATRCPRSPTAGPSARPAPAALGIRAGVRGRGRAGRGRPPVVRHARALVGALGGGRFRSARGWCRRGRSGRSRSACAERGSLPG